MLGSNCPNNENLQIYPMGLVQVRLQKATPMAEAAVEGKEGPAYLSKPNALFQALWKARYLTEIEEIRLEIQRLEDIANSLPVECWNMIRLEP